MSNYTFNDLKDEYTHKWASMVITPDRLSVAKSQANKIIAHKDRYVKLEEQTKVPWYFIGLVHLRESNCDFDTHLHNGDPLHNGEGHYLRTVHKPSNRPKAKPINGVSYTFEESAIDALQDYKNIKDWSIEQIAYNFEKYNGFGYRMRNTPSPYLWASSNQYVKGKFIYDGADGWRPGVIDQQLGAMVVLKCLLEVTEPLPVIIPQDEQLVVSEEKPNTPTADITRPTSIELSATSRKFNAMEWMQWILGAGGPLSIFATVASSSPNYYTIIAIALLCAIVFALTMYVKKLIKDDVVENRYTPSKGAKWSALT